MKNLHMELELEMIQTKNINSNYDVSQEQNERVNEESRVLYVALTRAIRNVVWMKDRKSKSKISWQSLMEV